MKFIKLTSSNGSGFIYVNPETIGHLYQDGEEGKKYTRVGTTTHNNGGFKVAEDIEQILKLVASLK